MGLSYTSLEQYDFKTRENTYNSVEGTFSVLTIRIPCYSTSDVVVADISTQINQTDGRAYVDGYYIKDSEVVVAYDGIYPFIEIKGTIVKRRNFTAKGVN